MDATWVSAIADCITALAALMAVVIAGRELRKLTRQIKIAGLSALLQLEADINGRKHAVDDAAARLGQAQADKKEDAITAVLEGELKGRIENYINALDRLAWCIRNKYLPEKQFREEYEGYLRGVVRDYNSCFLENTPYNNILYVVDRWNKNPVRRKQSRI